MRDATEFERLADAMLYQPLPRSRTPDHSGVLPSYPLDDDDETFGPPESARVPQMRVTPVTPLLVLSDDDRRSPLARAGYKHRPEPEAPPESTRRVVDAQPNGPVILPAFMVLRGGATPRGLGSSLAFLGLLAVAVVTMVLLALAIVMPGSDWALIQG